MRALFSVWIVVSLTFPCAAQQRQSAESNSTRASPTNGSYYALVIGINRYLHEPTLRTAVSDATAVETLLGERYGFKTRVLLDAEATRTNILNALAQYRRTLGDNDKLLVYYAGHGVRDGDKAYWLPVDADRESTANWIIADDITTAVRVIPAKHVLIVSDSCFSGGLTRNGLTNTVPADHDAAIARLLNSRSRILISSGRDEPVADGGRDGHSVFAAALLTGLARMTDRSFTALTLFDQYIREPVVGTSEQVPLYQIVQNSGHDGGDFVFFQSTKLLDRSRPSPIDTPGTPKIQPQTSGPVTGPAPSPKSLNDPDPGDLFSLGVELTEWAVIKTNPRAIALTGISVDAFERNLIARITGLGLIVDHSDSTNSAAILQPYLNQLSRGYSRDAIVLGQSMFLLVGWTGRAKGDSPEAVTAIKNYSDERENALNIMRGLTLTTSVSWLRDYQPVWGEAGQGALLAKMGDIKGEIRTRFSRP